MKKALIITWEKFQDHETIYPFYRLEEEGFEVDIMSNKVGKIFGILGAHVDSTLTVDSLKDPSEYARMLLEYDVLIIPGGVKALDRLHGLIAIKAAFFYF